MVTHLQQKRTRVENAFALMLWQILGPILILKKPVCIHAFINSEAVVLMVRRTSLGSGPQTFHCTTSGESIVLVKRTFCDGVILYHPVTGLSHAIAVVFILLYRSRPLPIIWSFLAPFPVSLFLPSFPYRIENVDLQCITISPYTSTMLSGP